MNNILLTGGAGYIGSHIAELLSKKKINNVFILDDLSTGHEILINKKSHFFKGNINNIRLVKKIINKYNIDTIIHLAAALNVSEAEKNKKKYYNINIDGTKNLILSCKDSNVKNFIFSSSCSIYGNIKGGVDEKKKLKPQGYYGYTKLKGEELIQKYSKKFNYNFGIFRYFNVAGASLSGKIGEIETSHGHLIKNIAIQSISKKPEINIYGRNYPTKDGTCIRDYIHVSDLADIHIKGLNYLNKNNKSFILNCGYGRGYSVLQIANVFKKIKKNLKIKFAERRPGDLAQIYSNTKKFKKLLKWKPKNNNINKIIKSAIKWERKLLKTFN